MTEKPRVLVFGEAVHEWTERWRNADPVDVDAAVAEGVSLCDAVIAWAKPLLANAAVRPPSPDHLLRLRAILCSWSTGAWRLGKRLPTGQEAPTLAEAVNRASASVRALATAEAAIRATMPPKLDRTVMTQQEARDAIRKRRATGG